MTDSRRTTWRGRALVAGVVLVVLAGSQFVFAIFGDTGRHVAAGFALLAFGAVVAGFAVLIAGIRRSKQEESQARNGE